MRTTFPPPSDLHPLIDPDRLARVEALADGAHDPSDGAMCAMEAVSWIAREPWSDRPTCACPVIGAFMRAWNDGLPDDERTALLLPLIPRLVGTKGSSSLENRRVTMAVDWLIRTHTPAWLRLAGLAAQADALAGLPEIVDFAQVPSIRGPIEAARNDAAAARAAARAAAKARLEPTRRELQRSALALVERMIALTDANIAHVGESA